MDSERILAVNIPNGISILIMVAVGGLILTFGRKLLGGKGMAGVSTGPAFSG